MVLVLHRYRHGARTFDCTLNLNICYGTTDLDRAVTMRQRKVQIVQINIIAIELCLLRELRQLELFTRGGRLESGHGAGILRTCFGLTFLPSRMPLASPIFFHLRASPYTAGLAAIFCRVSPATTVYSLGHPCLLGPVEASLMFLNATRSSATYCSTCTTASCRTR